MGEVERNVEGSISRHALGRNKSREDRLDEARAVKLGKLGTDFFASRQNGACFFRSTLRALTRRFSSTR